MAPRSAVTLLLVLLSFSGIYADKILFLRWPGGVCYNQVCCYPSTFPKKDIFLVQYLASTNASVCNVTYFESLPIEPVLEDLQTFWPSLNCPSNSGIRDWETVWELYGGCTGFTEAEYFEKALVLREEADLLTKLAEKGIMPSNNETYALSDVEDAINDGFGVKTAVLDCKSSALSTIRNIRLCVDETATTFIECPEKANSTCASTVTLKLLLEDVAEEGEDDAELSAQLIETVSSE